MLSKTGKDTSGKSKSNFRRTVVFRFIMGCQSKEICAFLDMVFSSFHSFMSGLYFKRCILHWFYLHSKTALTG